MFDSGCTCLLFAAVAGQVALFPADKGMRLGVPVQRHCHRVKKLYVGHSLELEWLGQRHVLKGHQLRTVGSLVNGILQFLEADRFDQVGYCPEFIGNAHIVLPGR